MITLTCRLINIIICSFSVERLMINIQQSIQILHWSKRGFPTQITIHTNLTGVDCKRDKLSKVLAKIKTKKQLIHREKKWASTTNHSKPIVFQRMLIKQKSSRRLITCTNKWPCKRMVEVVSVWRTIRKGSDVTTFWRHNLHHLHHRSTEKAG